RLDVRAGRRHVPGVGAVLFEPHLDGVRRAQRVVDLDGRGEELAVGDAGVEVARGRDVGRRLRRDRLAVRDLDGTRRLVRVDVAAGIRCPALDLVAGGRVHQLTGHGDVEGAVAGVEGACTVLHDEESVALDGEVRVATGGLQRALRVHDVDAADLHAQADL